jgi:UDP-2-acetamido-3-amino-2,3-dideoxy-glucuronate N-acetyltransferase
MSDPKILKTGIRDSTFGEGCVVADCVNIYEARFGDRCFVGPWVEVQRAVIVGTNVRIQSHTLICEEMRIGDDVFIGHGVMTANARRPRSGAADWLCEPPVIGNRVSIGSNVTILPGVIIEDDAVIGAGAIVTKNVSRGTTVVGIDRVVKEAR